jgi:hypothetical protein
MGRARGKRDCSLGLKGLGLLHVFSGRRLNSLADSVIAADCERVWTSANNQAFGMRDCKKGRGGSWKGVVGPGSWEESNVGIA